MNIYSIIETVLLAIVFTAVTLVGIPNSTGKGRNVEIPHLVISFILAFLTVKGYNSSNTLLMVIPPLIVVVAAGYTAWVCRKEWPTKSRRNPEQIEGHVKEEDSISESGNTGN